MGNYANSADHKNSFILAPNYPAGKDALTGYKRLYKGNLAGEIYTKLGQKTMQQKLLKLELLAQIVCISSFQEAWESRL